MGVLTTLSLCLTAFSLCCYAGCMHDPNDCGCGGPAEDFMYLRPEKKLPTGDSEVQWTGAGHWYCRHCRSPVLPNRARGHLSKDDRGRIGRVAQLHSNDGWGDEFRHAAVIACRLPSRNGPAFDTPPTAG